MRHSPSGIKPKVLMRSIIPMANGLETRASGAANEEKQPFKKEIYMLKDTFM